MAGWGAAWIGKAKGFGEVWQGRERYGRERRGMAKGFG